MLEWEIHQFLVPSARHDWRVATPTMRFYVRRVLVTECRANHFRWEFCESVAKLQGCGGDHHRREVVPVLLMVAFSFRGGNHALAILLLFMYEFWMRRRNPGRRAIVAADRSSTGAMAEEMERICCRWLRHNSRLKFN